ncbi:hypothetical protein MKX03_026954 [Papaver bracteatum]|nr:hypothetical protein MKX03_026954 [Papaver bracteatum]
MIAPQLVGSLSISHEKIKLDDIGRPDESLAVEIFGFLFATSKEENLQKGTILSLSIQKGQLTNVCYQPRYSANVEVKHLPLDELEMASLRGTIQRTSLIILVLLMMELVILILRIILSWDPFRKPVHFLLVVLIV